MPPPERNLRKTPLLSLLLHCPHLLVLVRFKRQALAYFEAIRVMSPINIQTWNHSSAYTLQILLQLMQVAAEVFWMIGLAKEQVEKLAVEIFKQRNLDD